MDLTPCIIRPLIELAEVNFRERSGFRVLAWSQSVVDKRIYVEGVTVFEHVRFRQVDPLLHTIDIAIAIV